MHWCAPALESTFVLSLCLARLDVRRACERIPYLAEASANLTSPPSTRVSTCVVNYSANIWGGSTTCGAALKVNLSIQLCHRNERTGARDGHVQCTSRQHARRRMAPSASLLSLARLDVRRLGRARINALPRPRQHARTWRQQPLTHVAGASLHHWWWLPQESD